MTKRSDLACFINKGLKGQLDRFLIVLGVAVLLSAMLALSACVNRSDPAVEAQPERTGSVEAETEDTIPVEPSETSDDLTTEDTEDDIPDLNLEANKQTIYKTMGLFIDQGAIVLSDGTIDLSPVNNGMVGVTFGDGPAYTITSAKQDPDGSFTVTFTDQRLGTVTVSK